MKTSTTLLFCITCLHVFSGCNKTIDMPHTSNTTQNMENTKLIIIIGSNKFIATFYNNAAAAAFKTKLPFTITMNELNGNEKHFDLPYNLPTNASNPGTIQAGDLMLYGSNTLVLFYKTFSTSYSYTPMGRIDDTSGLAAALGSGNATVTFALQ